MYYRWGHYRVQREEPCSTYYPWVTWNLIPLLWLTFLLQALTVFPHKMVFGWLFGCYFTFHCPHHSPVDTLQLVCPTCFWSWSQYSKFRLIAWSPREDAYENLLCPRVCHIPPFFSSFLYIVYNVYEAIGLAVCNTDYQNYGLNRWKLISCWYKSLIWNGSSTLKYLGSQATCALLLYAP